MQTRLTEIEWGRFLGQRIIDGQTGELCPVRVEAINIPTLIKYDHKPLLRSFDYMTAAEHRHLEYLHEYPIDALEITEYGIDAWDRDCPIRIAKIAALDWLTQQGFDIRGDVAAGRAIAYNPEKHGVW